MMLGFPRTTEYNKRVPKQKFYENLDISPALKRAFVEQIRLIYWRNKLAASTMNVAEGKAVTEIEVLELKLYQPSLDEAVLRLIDTSLSYHILFILEYDGRYQAWISYKEAASGASAFRVYRYYHSDWLEPERLSLRLDGLTLDAVYEGLVRQCRELESLECGVWSEELSIAQNVANDEKKLRLQKQISAIENKMRREKQFNRQVEMNAELKRLKKEMESI